MTEPDPEPRPKPSPKVAISNFRAYDAPFFTKLRMTVQNNMTKIRNRQDCCGNYGQPGC